MKTEPITIDERVHLEEQICHLQKKVAEGEEKQSLLRQKLKAAGKMVAEAKARERKHHILPLKEPQLAKYAWSAPGRRDYFVGGFDTREEALQAAHDALDGEGEGVVFTAQHVPDVMAHLTQKCSIYLLDHMADVIADECGIEWFDRVTTEQRASLDARIAEAVTAWAKEHGFEPDFFLVHEVEEHKLQRKQASNA